MKITNLIIIITLTTLLFYSCEKEPSGDTIIKNKLVGTWIWTATDSSTVQIDTTEYNIGVVGCSNQMEFKIIKTWETLWEFELDGDFEEKISYDNMEEDFQESQKYCEEKYKNIVYTREMIGDWKLENNNSGLEIRQKHYYGDDTTYHDYLIITLTEEKLILEKDDINKTRVAFEKWE